MATVPLSPEECHLLAMAARSAVGPPHEATAEADRLLLDLAGRLEGAARLDSLPPAREDRWNPAWPKPPAVDTFLQGDQKP